MITQIIPDIHKNSPAYHGKVVRAIRRKLQRDNIDDSNWYEIRPYFYYFFHRQGWNHVD